MVLPYGWSLLELDHGLPVHKLLLPGLSKRVIAISELTSETSQTDKKRKSRVKDSQRKKLHERNVNKFKAEYEK